MSCRGVGSCAVLTSVTTISSEACDGVNACSGLYSSFIGKSVLLYCRNLILYFISLIFLKELRAVLVMARANVVTALNLARLQLLVRAVSIS